MIEQANDVEQGLRKGRSAVDALSNNYIYL